VAREELETGALTGDLEEFFREVVNVLAKLLNSPTTPHVRLGEVYRLPGPVPVAVAGLVLEPAARDDHRVTIDGYGPGSMTFLAI
jgi:hypothetical protein